MKIIEQAYDNQNFVYFDIETIPSQSPELLAEYEKNVTPPASCKKPESIEKWLEENRASAAADALAKTSFDGGRGHVCSIAWAINNGTIHSAHMDKLDAERLVIQSFFDALDAYHRQTLVGHYISGFDIPFLKKRAICLGVALPDRQSFPRDPKPWGNDIFDTMTAWAGARDRVSMNELCSIFGIEGKGDFDGSQVADAWLAGEHAKITEYCRDDVRRTREIHQRFLAANY